MRIGATPGLTQGPDEAQVSQASEDPVSPLLSGVSAYEGLPVQEGSKSSSSQRLSYRIKTETRHAISQNRTA